MDNLFSRLLPTFPLKSPPLFQNYKIRLTLHFVSFTWTWGQGHGYSSIQSSLWPVQLKVMSKLVPLKSYLMIIYLRDRKSTWNSDPWSHSMCRIWYLVFPWGLWKCSGYEVSWNIESISSVQTLVQLIVCLVPFSPHLHQHHGREFS